MNSPYAKKLIYLDIVLISMPNIKKYDPLTDTVTTGPQIDGKEDVIITKQYPISYNVDNRTYNFAKAEGGSIAQAGSGGPKASINKEKTKPTWKEILIGIFILVVGTAIVKYLGLL